MQKSMLGLAALGVAVFGLMSPAVAQASLDEIENQLNAGTSDLERVDQMLASEDANRRIAAMEALLNSGNPTFVRRAQHVGLLSSDPGMQIAALDAILDKGGPLRFEFDFSQLTGEALKSWNSLIADYGTLAISGKGGTIVFDVQGYNEEKRCHVTVQNRSSCFAQIAGAKVSFPLDFWSRVRGVASLSADGAMTGEMSYDGFIAPFRVPLVE